MTTGKNERRALREILPQLEVDWLLPAWLLLAILSAAVAETVTVGLGVQNTYHLWTGWAIGGVVASVQAIGSMMLARALQHNANRKVYKSKNRQSEPAQNVWLPALASVMAGFVSGWVGIALYGTDGSLTVLDLALGVASPAGSITVALLNGVFAYSESAIAEWRAENAGGRSTVQPSAQPAEPDSLPAVSPRSQQRIACEYCGATANQRGEPFANQQAISAHLRYCSVYQASPDAERAKGREEFGGSSGGRR